MEESKTQDYTNVLQDPEFMNRAKTILPYYKDAGTILAEKQYNGLLRRSVLLEFSYGKCLSYIIAKFDTEKEDVSILVDGREITLSQETMRKLCVAWLQYELDWTKVLAEMGYKL